MSKHILVVGGTSGIGAGIAQAFKDQDPRNHVTVTGVTQAEVDEYQVREPYQDIAAHVLDVRDNDAVIRLISNLSQLNVLVNCAGVIRRGDELKPEVFASVVDINLNGTMRVCAAARALLKANPRLHHQHCVYAKLLWGGSGAGL
jgi:Short-chain dehydrogenase involved in D-alanine esterification of lipoteichoic acid and wall teichoic acid (D-alanine transfer protein)